MAFSAEKLAELEEGLDLGVLAVKPSDYVRAVCSTEDSHKFNSTGQCDVCGSHRRPMHFDVLHTP